MWLQVRKTSVTRSGLSWLAEGLAVSGLKRRLFYLCCRQEKSLYIHRNVNRALNMTQQTLEVVQALLLTPELPAEMDWAGGRQPGQGVCVCHTAQGLGKDRRTGTSPAGFGENSPPLRRTHKKNWHHLHTLYTPYKEKSERTNTNGRKK